MTEENESTTEGVETTESKIENLDEAIKEIAKLRREAASKRVKNKDLEEKAKQWEQYTESQKTELQKLTDRANELEREANNLRKANKAAQLVVKYKIDPEFADLLVGETDEELEAKAKKLSSLKGNAGKTPDFYAGQRGNAPKPAADNLNDWFKDWYKSVDNKFS